MLSMKICNKCSHLLKLNYHSSPYIMKHLFHTSCVSKKIVPNNLKGKSKSSQEWLTRQLNDPFVKRARYENYRARSAFKLIEIDEKYEILRPGMIVVECGAAPGSWTQVLVKRLKLDGDNPQKTGAVIAIDINSFHHVPGAVIMPHTDITKPLHQANVLHVLNGKHVDLLCSDMAPNAMGLKEFDHNAILRLCISALHFSITVLRPGNGTFLTKLWDGSNTNELLKIANKFFQKTEMIKPDASRDDSAEVFLLAKNFKGILHK